MAALCLAPVMVSVAGPDGVVPSRQAGAAFYAARDGRTALSCSGLCFQGPAGQLHALAPATLLAPFLSRVEAGHKPGWGGTATSAELSELRLDAEATLEVSFTVASAPVLPPLRASAAGGAAAAAAPAEHQQRSIVTLPAHILRILHVPEHCEALQQLPQQLSAATGRDWRLGWGLQPGEPAAAAAAEAPRLQGSYALLRIDCDAAQAAQLMASTTPTAWVERGPAAQPLPAGSLLPGCRTEVFASPFGCLAPAHFANSIVSAGIANVVHLKQQGLPPAGSSASANSGSRPPPSLYLLDGQLFPGAEGAMVVVDQQPEEGGGGSRVRLAAAVVATPLCRRADGLQVHLALPLTPLLAAALTTTDSSHGQGTAPSGCSSSAAAAAGASAAQGIAPWTPPPAAGSILAACNASSPSAWPPRSVAPSCPGQQRAMQLPPSALQGVVLIRCQSQWASGVLITASGIILTNAHLFPAAAAAQPHSHGARCSVRLDLPQGGSCWAAARLLHVFRNHLDLAVLRLASPHLLPGLRPLQLLPRAQRAGLHLPGLPIAVVGHGLFGPSLPWQPSVSLGNVTQVVSGATGPTMLITSAAVHSGSSGGAVLRLDDGALLGLVTSNCRHAASGTTLPTINFSIAAHELAGVVDWAARLPATMAPRSSSNSAADTTAAVQCASSSAPPITAAPLAAAGSSQRSLRGEEDGFDYVAAAAALQQLERQMQADDAGHAGAAARAWALLPPISSAASQSSSMALEHHRSKL